MSDIVTSSDLFSGSVATLDVEAHGGGFESRGTASTAANTSESAAERLTREQVVDRILSMNTTARTDFLGSFSDAALRDYLDHLQSATIPRGPQARWVRRSGTRAVVMSEPRD